MADTSGGRDTLAWACRGTPFHLTTPHSTKHIPGSFFFLIKHTRCSFLTSADAHMCTRSFSLPFKLLHCKKTQGTYEQCK